MIVVEASVILGVFSKIPEIDRFLIVGDQSLNLKFNIYSPLIKKITTKGDVKDWGRVTI